MKRLFHWPKKSADEAIGQKQPNGTIHIVATTALLRSRMAGRARPAIRDRSNAVVATMWIVPFGCFWPIASSADFFGQWNNLFMWSALAVALAGAQIGGQNAHASKG